MVRTSNRQKVLNRLDDLIDTAAKRSLTLQTLGLNSAKVDASMLKLSDLSKSVKRNRHLNGKPHRTGRQQKFDLCLRTDHDDYLSDREFKFHFRVSRDCFWQLVDLIEDHKVFHGTSDARGQRPKPAAHQLSVLLKHLGSEGNAGSSSGLSTFFGIALGAVDDCKKHALQALLTLEDRTHCWPSKEERRAISSRTKTEWLFPNCVGPIDGTLLPLNQRPLVHGENYVSRKRFYAVVMLAVCDDTGRILYCHIGWPGSVHDNRAWRNSNLHQHHAKYFSPKECPLGDSAFTPSDIMIPAFKSVAGSVLDSNQSAFNTHLAKPRVKSEHCIGVLKGRLPFLRSIRMVLGNKLHMDKTIDCVRAAVVLHGFLIGDPAEEAWTIREEAVDFEPDESRSSGDQPDCNGRNELLCHLSELEETTIN